MARRSPAPGPASARVVLVEKNPVALALLEDFLVRSGVNVVAAATDAGQAWDAVVDQAPEVAVLDCHLPDEEVTDLCVRVRSAAPGLTVLVHYGYLSGSEQRELIALGAAAVVPKSVRGDDLIAALRKRQGA